MQEAIRGFLAPFQDVITDEIVIGSSRDDLLTETRANQWLITLSHEQRQSLTPSDLLMLFEKIIENRQQQLDQTKTEHGMIFYLWFDEQALQLRFNLISDSHKSLPFRCQLNVLPTPEPILDRYLHYAYHAAIPWNELHEVSQEGKIDDGEKPFVLDMYQMKLSPHQPVSFW
jgi:hypothetical protein